MEGETSDLYRECLRNHAATLGSYATDGCGEFISDDASPGGLQCAACGCHRNFHRKVAGGTGRAVTCSRQGGDLAETPPEMVDYGSGSRNRQHQVVESPNSERSSKKRFRTKFTEDQKEKMLAFAEKIGWKMVRKDEDDVIGGFCRGVGVSRQVFKVWMHNHKNSSSSISSASAGNASSLTTL
ncbi:hypothetical protein U1Q18_027808 [Sarracenia purpurea var. burkii]